MMNDRIKTLFKQAGGKTYTRNLMSNPVQQVENHELWDDHIEKFAQLIVQECMIAVGNHYHKIYETPAEDAIKEHFGVEE